MYSILILVPSASNHQSISGLLPDFPLWRRRHCSQVIVLQHSIHTFSTSAPRKTYQHIYSRQIRKATAGHSLTTSTSNAYSRSSSRRALPTRPLHSSYQPRQSPNKNVLWRSIPISRKTNTFHRFHHCTKLSHLTFPFYILTLFLHMYYTRLSFITFIFTS
jgi:hypothetical protein